MNLFIYVFFALNGHTSGLVTSTDRDELFCKHIWLYHFSLTNNCLGIDHNLVNMYPGN